MTTITKLINDIYNLQFTSNTFAEKKHENSVKEIFTNNGMVEIKKTDARFKFLKERKNSTKVVEELKGNYIFIEQPFGSQAAPDFIICVDGYILWIECKSGKDTLTWNTGYPKNNVLFVFSSKKRNTTTIFFGQNSEILTNNPTFEEKYVEFDKKLKQLSKESFGDEFKSEYFSFYMRKMLNDKTKYSDPSVRLDYYNKAKAILGI